MRILKPVGEEIDFDGKIRHLLFNVNVIDDIQDHFDMGIADVLNSIYGEDKVIKKKSYDTLSYVLTSLLCEDVRLHNKYNPNDQWDDITEEYIREELVTNNTAGILTALVINSFNGNLPNETDKSPNTESRQAKK